jgi:hypothetical protein
MTALDLLAQPEELYAAWRQALRDNPHLHGPEAAARLRVPEAALMVSACGRGNTSLSGALAELLAPAAAWGRVLVASRNGLGVKLDVLGQAQAFLLDDGGVRLSDAHHDIVLSAQGIARFELFEEEDGHGRTLSLNWFDGQGHVVGRLFLMSKSGREDALPHLMAFATAAQSRHWAPQALSTPPIAAWPDEAGEPLPGAAVEWARAAILACDAVPLMRLALSGRGARSVYTGPLSKTSSTPPAVHATDLLCKLHARPAGAQHARKLYGGGLEVRDAEGAALQITPATEPAAWWARVHALWQERSPA